MSLAGALSRGRARPGPLATLSPTVRRAMLAAAVVFVLLMSILPTAALGAFLMGWLVLLSACMGASVLLYVHALTGGRWGEAGAPAMRALAAAVPPVAFLGLVPILGQGLLYPWTADGALADKPMVAALYLDPWLFAIRGIAILVAWSAMAWVVAAPKPPRKLFAGLALTFYGVTVNFAAFDWLMSLDPSWTSTAFGAFFAILQIALALALLVRAVGTGPVLSEAYGESSAAAVRADLAMLLLAAILGVVYLVFMQFLVQWSGNLPEKVAFFVARAGWSWSGLLTVAFLVGGTIPFAILSRSDLRRHRRAVAVAGAGVLVGGTLLVLWFAAPSLDSAAAIPLGAAAMTAAVYLAERIAKAGAGGDFGRSPAREAREGR